MAKKKGGLGMGLDALFDDNSSDIQTKQTLRISDIEPNKAQPRRDFDDEAIANLADSIRQHGVLQPLLVRPLENNTYQIVAGERRWRAARMAGIDEVPVLIRELSDYETMQVALIENLQREDLNPIEEALGYKDLMDTYNMTQEEVSKTVGKSRSAIANFLRVLNLPDEIQELLRKNEISIGHAKALASINDNAIMIEVANKAAVGKITVRGIENLARDLADAENKEVKSKKVKSIDSYFKEMELGLKNELGRKVKISSNGDKGVLTLEFYDKEDLKDLADKLTIR